MSKKSTVAQGNEFRDRVALLLKSKYDDVRVEENIGGKNIDVVFTESRIGRREVVAVECKSQARAITATQFSREILPDYEPLLRNGSIDLLVIVGNRSIESAASERIRSERRIAYLTYEELEESLLGLSAYVNNLAKQASNDGLDSYYVESRFEGSDKSAVVEIKEWLADSASSAMAILGGYGQGKTSLAISLVAELARDHLSDSRRRIPIFIRLGSVVHETTLEGLFGREFGSIKSIDYSFSTFLHLNNSGRLVVVLDGFDEMRHGMRGSDFRANLHEFNRLVSGKSKVILLGRPNSFDSVETREYVFGGNKKSFVGLLGARPVWNERRLALFSKVEVCTFIEKYMSYLYKSVPHLISKNQSPRSLAIRAKQIVGELDHELICRPVHAKLIAELAIYPGFSFVGFSEYDLYNQCLIQLLRRDAEQKRARKPISVEHRMLFQERLAYWAWSRKNDVQGVFLREEIPAALLHKLPDGGTEDLSSKMSEYIVSTVTDEKDAGCLGFSHRSFQEFLVASHLMNWDVRDVHEWAEALNNSLDEAVVQFIKQAPDESQLLTWFNTLLKANAFASEILVDALLCHGAVVNDLMESANLIAASRKSQIRSVAKIEVVGWYLLRKNFLNGGFLDKVLILDVALRNVAVADVPAVASLSLLYILLNSKAVDSELELAFFCLVERPAALHANLFAEDKKVILGSDALFDLAKAAFSASPSGVANRKVFFHPGKMRLALIHAARIELGGRQGKLLDSALHMKSYELKEYEFSSCGQGLTKKDILDFIDGITSPFGRKIG